MDTQFSNVQTRAAMGLKFIPEQMCSSPVSASELEWFNDDLPFPQSLPAESHLIRQARLKGVPNPPTSLQGSVAHCDSQLYPTIYTVCPYHVCSFSHHASVKGVSVPMDLLRQN
ncbi:hypothetical protein DPMN_006037 [Dreissena polymorpha]|uniref:Uncharacterized protein n=1 Tax=Dreissena polymorpha TaxID=45954 RepID=A0A9D4RUH2_DREPO|nr:hypothetical protein DPMN_006037 [Dreissena polymorpha]